MKMTEFKLLHIILLICLKLTLSFTTVPPAYRVATAAFSNPTGSRPTDDDESSTSSSDPIITSFLLRISYDGTRFTGWSAANDDTKNGEKPSSKMMRRRRRRRRGSLVALPPGRVRSVQGVLRQNLAKLYGNVDPRRIVVEGSSRTDKGVHARGMIAQVYCLTEDALNFENATTTTSSNIPGKRLPHPLNSTDTTCFVPIRASRSKVAFALNRMAHEVKIMAIAPVPNFRGTSNTTTTTTTTLTASAAAEAEAMRTVFHPTLAATSKTYEYTLSFGPFHDPITYMRIWHLDQYLDLHQCQQVVQVLTGKHDFRAFQGAPRSKSDRAKRQKDSYSTVCTVYAIDIKEYIHDWNNRRSNSTSETNPTTATMSTTSWRIRITGDRFLYKMVRFLVGAMVAVAKGDASVNDIQHALDTGIRPTACLCAPAWGLVMEYVDYDSQYWPIEWDTANS